MSQNKSIFDLSPSEKLQLVEDLWDNLASNPDDTPVFDWQKKELDRRKKNLQEIPSAGSTWEQVKQRFRNLHEN